MNPIIITKREEKISICFFNPEALTYDEVLRFEKVEDFRDYVYMYIQVATQDMITLSSNMRIFALALQEMPRSNAATDYVKSMGDIKLGTNGNIGED